MTEFLDEKKIGEMTILKMRYVDIDDVARWDRNPKRHDIGAIVHSIRIHGFRDAPIFDGTANCIIAGNGRSIALQSMRDAGEELPIGIIVLNSKWYMPVQFGIDATSKELAEAFGLDHNNITLLGGDFDINDISKLWKEDEFIELGKSLLLDGVEVSSFDGDDIDYLINKQAKKLLDTDEPDEPDDEQVSNLCPKCGYDLGVSK